MHMSSVCIYKGQFSLILVKTGCVWIETRPEFIDIQNFYFHFHFKSACVRAEYLS